MSVIHLNSFRGMMSIKTLVLGNFDGVHLGHKALISEALKLSSSDGEEGVSGVLTFAPHPREFFEPNVYNRIYEPNQNYRLILEEGVSKVFVEEFDENLSRLSASDFLDKAFSKIQFKNLVVGFDFKLGKDRSGGQKDLKMWCDQNGVFLHVLSCVEDGGEKISSSRIKGLLKDGDTRSASRLLGKDYAHTAVVKADQGLGAKIGSPTLNVFLSPDVVIKKGVYAGKCRVQNKMHHSISNIGFRPTVSKNQNQIVLETHILDSGFEEPSTSFEIEVFLQQFLRPEKKFSSIEELRVQIQEDIRASKALLDSF